MIKRLLFLLVLVLSVVIDSRAQLPMEGDWRSRLGTKDPKKAEASFIEYFATDSLHFKKGKYNRRSYELFRKLRNLAPYCDYSFYNYAILNDQDEKFLFNGLMKEEKDPAVRLMYLQDLLELADALITERDSINVLRANSHLQGGAAMAPLTEGVASLWRAHLVYKYGKKYMPAELYKQEEVYDNYKKAFDLYTKEGDKSEEDVEGVYLGEYFDSCYDLYKTDTVKYYQQFLEDYLHLVTVCDHVLLPAYNAPDEATKIQILQRPPFSGYDWYSNEIKMSFANSGAGSAERLNSYFGSALNSHRKDKEFLNNAIHLMYENNAIDMDAFYEYCEVAHDIEPTYKNALGFALSCKRDGLTDDMVTYLKEAKTLGKNDGEVALCSYLIGVNLISDRPKYMKPMEDGTEKETPYATDTPEYQKWFEGMNIAVANLKDVLNYSESLMKSERLYDRTLCCRASHELGRCYMRRMSRDNLGDCDLAINYFRQAERLGTKDVSYDESANIASVENSRSRYKKDLATIAQNKKLKDLYEKQQREYQAYLRKKAEEEKFWQGR